MEKKEFNFVEVAEMVYNLDCSVFQDYLKAAKENAQAEWKAYEDAREKALAAEGTEFDEDILNALYGEVDKHCDSANAWERIADEMDELLEKTRFAEAVIDHYGFRENSPLYCGIPNRYFGK